MNTPLTKQHSSPARTQKMMDKIIHKRTNSPTKRTDTDSEQVISIIPASSSTPIGNTYTSTPQQDNTEQTHSPEERQIIHMEEGQADDVPATSSISSLNTADIEALDKILINQNFNEEGEVWGTRSFEQRTQPGIPPTIINAVKLYYIYIYIYIYIYKYIYIYIYIYIINVPTGIKLMLIYVKFILSPIGDNKIVSLSNRFVHNSFLVPTGTTY